MGSVEELAAKDAIVAELVALLVECRRLPAEGILSVGIKLGLDTAAVKRCDDYIRGVQEKIDAAVAEHGSKP